MSSVDLYSIKSGDLSPLCCFPIFLYDSHDLIFRKWTRNLSTGFGRNIRSGYRLHICSCRLCGSSCVIDLDTAKANFETLIMEKYPDLTEVVWP